MINLDGQLVSPDAPFLSASNRAFRYGDSLFESIRMFDGRLPFLPLHVDRLFRGMEVLKINKPPHFSLDFFEKEIKKTTTQSDLINCRIRLIVYRSGAGLYTPEKNDPSFLIELESLKTNMFEWSSQGLQVGLFRDLKINPSIITFFKSGNSLPFVMANLFRKENNLDDVLVFNVAGNIACGGSSNLFLVNNNKIITPPISEGCVDGTMRKELLRLAANEGKTIKEQPVSVSDLEKADEAFLTNAIHGVRSIKEIVGIKKWGEQKTSKQLFNLLAERLAKK